MKIFLGLIGAGASLYAVLQAVAFVGVLGDPDGALAASKGGATLGGTAIGAVIALVCFRKCMAGKPAAVEPQEG